MKRQGWNWNEKDEVKLNIWELISKLKRSWARRRRRRQHRQSRRPSWLWVLLLTKKTRQVGRDSVRTKRVVLGFDPRFRRRSQRRGRRFASFVLRRKQEDESVIKQKKEKKEKIIGPVLCWHVVGNHPKNRSQ